MTTTKVATEALVTIGSIQFIGLKLSAKTYGISVKQVAALFDLDAINIQRNLQRWVDGIKFITCQTDCSLRQKIAEKVIILSDFEEVIIVMSGRGNKVARMLNRACLGVGLDVLVKDAFGDVQTQSERQAISHTRRMSINTRKEECKQLSFASICKNSWQYAAITNQMYLGLFGKDAAALKTELGTKSIRDNLDEEQLAAIIMVERRIAKMAETYVMEWSAWLDFVRNHATNIGKNLK